VYTRPDFVTQVYETLSALRCSKILGIILAEPKVQVAAKMISLSIINRILSMTDCIPSDVMSVFNDIFVEDDCSKVVHELLALNNREVTLKCIIMIGLLARLDKLAAMFWSKSERLRNVLSTLEKCDENEMVKSVNFCKKWVGC
jgi:hypothetical protein